MYGNFAYIYDRLMQDVPYDQWLAYLDELFVKLDLRLGKALDLGCGTGTLTVPLAQKGWQVTAVDLSADMLAVAESKAREEGVQVHWVQQDMRQLQVGTDFDLVISMCDSLNYITEVHELELVFKQTHQALRDGGIFFFDLNSHYKLSRVFGDNVFTINEEEIAYIWENEFDAQEQVCLMDITFFVQEPSGYFRRFSEFHRERAYQVSEVQTALTKAGFTLIGKYAEQTFNEPDGETERIYYVAQKA